MVPHAGQALDSTWRQLCQAIGHAMFNVDHVHCKYLKWMTVLDSTRQQEVLLCCTHSLHDVQSSIKRLKLSEEERSHVLMLRGLLAFDVLLHCLMKRHNVDYGITDRYDCEPCWLSKARMDKQHTFIFDTSIIAQ